MTWKPEIIETPAGAAPAGAVLRMQTGLAPHGPQPPAPPRVHDPEEFPVPVRVACGVIAAAFAAGVYLVPNLPALFFVRAIFAFGVWLFGQIAVFGRFGSKPASS